MIHLPPLPGAPSYKGQAFSQILDETLSEAAILDSGNVDGILIQNSNDGPFLQMVEPETIAYMSVLTAAVKKNCRCSVGLNVLPVGGPESLSIAHAAGADFVRIKVYFESVVSSEGVFTGEARKTLLQRNKLGADNIEIAADVHYRGSEPFFHIPTEEAARWTWTVGSADAVITACGNQADTIDRFRRIRSVLPDACLICGGGANARNVKDFYEVCDGIIIGAAIKYNNSYSEKTDPDKLAVLMESVYRARKR